jgi:PilZ domain
MTTTSKGERRVKSRKRPISLVYVELTGANGGMMKDLSPEGFSLRAMMALRLGEQTRFSFNLSESVRIEGEGQVVWVEENGRVAGIQFTKVSPSVLEEIQSWLVRPETPPKREHVGGTAQAVRDTTLQELREEIHTVPPRSEGTAPAPVERAEPPVERVEPPVKRPAPPVVERTAPPVIEAPLARVVEQQEPRVAEEPAPIASKPPEPIPVEVAPPPRFAPVQAPVEARVAPPVETPAPPVQETAPPPPPVFEAPVTRPVEPPTAPPAPAEPAEAAAPVPPVVPTPTPTSEPVFAQVDPIEAERPLAAGHEEKPAAEVPAAQTTAPVVEAPVEEKAIPALPRLRLDPPVNEPASKPAEFVPPATPFTPPAPIKREKWPLYVSTDPHPESQSPEAAPHTVPDISAVLIQPSASSSHAASLDAIASWDGEPAPRESKGMSVSTVIATMTVLALLAALYVFHQEVGQSLIWVGQTMGGAFQTNGQKPATTDSSGDSAGNSPASQNASTAPRDAAQDHPSSGQAEGGTNKAGAGTEKAGDAASAAANPAAVSPPAPSPVTNGNPAPSVSPPGGMPPATSAPGPEPGQVEYAEAMQILRGKNANNAQLTEVSRLLWVSVEKGNPSAELALAEMYWEGRGVARNCDQTHVLLTAAARKGSVEAQKRLQEFERQGCE